MRVRLTGWRPIGASIRPLRAIRPCATARYSRVTLCDWSWRTRSVVLVEPVHDSGARHAGQRGSVLEKRVQKCSMPVAVSGVHDHPGRLVDDYQRIVLVHDFERNILRAVSPRRGHGRGDDIDYLAAPHLVPRPHGTPIYHDLAGAHPLRQSAAGMFRQQPRENAV